MSRLIDFLNHGTLPTVGRAAERERLIEFWRGTAEAYGLRAAIVVGEAGIGKSRLVEEILPLAGGEGGAVVHIKLYPESATSIVPLAARAVARCAELLNLTRHETEESTWSVASGLRRFSHLRPTLLVIEDLHLLVGDARKEFSSILQSVADEPISLLCTSRPLDLGARSVLERFMVEEIMLEGLSLSDVGELWGGLFGPPPGEETIALLHQVTLGNCLALRSALQGAIRSGTIADDGEGRWRPVVPRDHLAEEAGRNIRHLSEGMASRLGPGEREAAEALASLGEIFARETAAAVLADAERTIEMLIFKGVLTTAVTMAAPLGGRASRRPLLAFTHTLLHRYFIDDAAGDPSRLVGVIGSDLPLYSIIPFQRLAEYQGEITATPEELDRAIERICVVVLHLDGSSDWRLGRNVWAGGRRLAAIREAQLADGDEEDLLALRGTVLHYSLRVARGFESTAREMIDRFIDLTLSCRTERTLEYRLLALAHLQSWIARRDYPKCLEIWEEVDGWGMKFPSLRETEAYVIHMRGIVLAARSMADVARLREVEKRFQEMLATASEATRTRIMGSVAHYYMDQFEDEEELEKRLALLAELERRAGPSNVGLPWQRTILFFELGRFGDVLAVADGVSERLRERGLMGSYAQSRLLRLYTEAAFGAQPEAMERQARRLLGELPEHHVNMARSTTGTYLAEGLLLQGSWEWGMRLYREFHAGNRPPAPIGMQILVALEGEEYRERLTNLEGENEGLPMRTFVAAILAAGEDGGRIEEAIAPIMAPPIMRRGALVEMISAIMLAERLATGGLPESARVRIAAALRRMLDWLAAGGAFAFMRPLVERFAGYLPEEEIPRRRAEIERVEQEWRAASGDEVRKECSLSMIGTIELTREGEEAPIRPRGTRVRTLLGLLVADMMLEKPLSNLEFYRIASGEEDLDRARSIVHVGTYRLRELIGSDMIRTDGPTPRLDPERVDVDLLRAHELLNQAAAAAREEIWLRAVPLLTRALDILGDDVIFPSLYDPFFEALRGDFDNRIRSVVAACARGLRREGDEAGAERLEKY